MEEAARQRLQRLKGAMASGQLQRDPESVETHNSEVKHLNNTQQQSQQEFKPANMEALADQYEHQLEDQVKTMRQQSQLDLEDLAPKKVDWDLKRDIEPQLQLLEDATQRKIVELVKQRLDQA
ncbi:hypothetical protein MP228_002273 [Amoeboaphelidium protococcarum]|nr:hypothetical protein MP228_002273 [Amoeboaphelidium protococcarum]